MTDDSDLPRLLELDDELPDDLRAGLAGLRARVATPEQLARMAAAVFPVAGSGAGSATDAAGAPSTGSTATALSGAKLALVGVSFVAVTAGLGAVLWHRSRSAARADASQSAGLYAPGAESSIAGARDGARVAGSGIGSTASSASSVAASGAARAVDAPGSAPDASGSPHGGSGSAAPNGAAAPRTADSASTAAFGVAARGGAAASAGAPSAGGPLQTSASAATAKTSRSSAPVDEGQMFRAARDALASDPSTTLRLADEHRRIYGNRSMGQEFELYAIEALARLGNLGAARDRAARFRREFPNSPYQKKVDSIVGSP